MTNKKLNNKKELPPWICPTHPNAKIRHSWDESHYILNGYPAGEGIKSNHKYECAECGLELKSDK